MSVAAGPPVTVTLTVAARVGSARSTTFTVWLPAAFRVNENWCTPASAVVKV